MIPNRQQDFYGIIFQHHGQHTNQHMCELKKLRLCLQYKSSVIVVELHLHEFY